MRRAPRWLLWTGRALAVLAALLLVLVAALHTAPGRQFLLDQVSSYAPASGLQVTAGDIEGSVLWSATFTDVEMRDADGVLFLEVPRVDLNWRPWKWFFSGLDLRHLVLSDGTLHAMPHLLPGDPEAPILPDFDIRVGRFVIEDLRVDAGVLGQERLVQLRARADVRAGRVLIDAEGAFDGADTFAALVDAAPDRDIFDLDLDWQAPAGGFLAGLAGAEQDMAVRLAGAGSWTRWDGTMQAQQGGAQLLDLALSNRAGRYRVAGQAYPLDNVSGLAARALGRAVGVSASGVLADSVLDGSFKLRSAAVALDGAGAVDLADNTFEGLAIDATLRDPGLFGTGVSLTDARLTGQLDGPFATARLEHTLTIGRAQAGTVSFAGVVQRGTVQRRAGGFVVPVDARVARVTSGAALFDPRLVGGTLGGTLVLDGSRLSGEALAVRFPGLTGQLALNADLAKGALELVGPVAAQGLVFADMGVIYSDANVVFALGGGQPWSLAARVQGRMARITNATLETLSGGNVRFAGGLSLGQGRPVSFAALRVDAAKLNLVVDGRIEGATTVLAGNGRHADYGPFTIAATLADDGPRAELLFADPYPAAGLKDVRVALAPQGQGFAITTSGQSVLGPFDGVLGLLAPPDGAVAIAVERLDVAETRATGQLRLVDGGLAGALELSRGGVNGTIGLAARPQGQAFTISLTARDARFGGSTPLTLAQATVDMRGFIGGDDTTIEGTLRAAGIGYGELFVGRMAADAAVRGGRGTFNAALAGRRGSRFELLLNGDATLDQIRLAARGSYAGQAITMPRRAVLQRQDNGGWQLEQTHLTYGAGSAVASGQFGGDGPNEGRLALFNMPIGLADVLTGELGVDGTVSGIVDYARHASGLPTGEARLRATGVTRSGLLLTSRPLDVAAVFSLSPTLLQMRGVVEDGGRANGRLDAQISDLPADGPLMQRLYRGDLFAQLRYDGPAEALWRVLAIDLIDLSGNVDVAANVRGSLGNPQVRGSLSGDDMRLQAALTGTDLTGVAARGRFDGSRLQLTSFSGAVGPGGRVSGSGFIDFSNISRDLGPQLDIRVAARNARLLRLPGMAATVTGPLRFISDGANGTIAGRLEVRDALWQLGEADERVLLPDVAITEINQPADTPLRRRAARPWRFLIDAHAARGLAVDGMGLDSEWGGDLRLRGTTADPRIGGGVTLVQRQGYYTFAGVRFAMTRGRIDFDEGVAPDPRLDILAESTVNGLNVDVAVRGNALRPEITFSSVPALPEEELMARLLFGGSITELSATDALQLGAALASLRGGAGLDPINRLRSAIGLDRLRIVPADSALGRGTSVALGENITRRFYIELITDGQGYTATQLEYRVTGWLSLLASINTLGRGSVAAEVSRDY